jgi:tRNA pseudouridine55 synthase
MSFLLIDKPPEITSFGVIARLRKITGIKKIGHAGTLDPFATGLLLVAVGRESTRELGTLLKKDKSYRATIHLGATTPTLDPESKITVDPNFKPPTEEQVKKAMEKLTGDIEQIPPMFSALKKDGQPLYKLARQGKMLDLPARPTHVHTFTLVSYNSPELVADISCASGTYIRALARDLAALLGTTGYVTALRRTTLSRFTEQQAVQLSALTPENWQNYTIAMVE